MRYGDVPSGLSSIFVVSEAGVMIIDDSGRVIWSRRFPDGRAYEEFQNLTAGILTEYGRGAVSAAKGDGVSEIVVGTRELADAIKREGVGSVVDAKRIAKAAGDMLQLMARAGLFSAEDEARDYIREFAMEASRRKIQELSARPDLQIMEGINSLDEVDKALNVMMVRVREWFGLHFPELSGLLEDPVSYAKLASRGLDRSKVETEDLRSLGLSEKRIEAILTSAEVSKGGNIRPEDLHMISLVAENALRLNVLREKLDDYVRAGMRRTAPNVSSIAGEAIGARLIAKAGGLEKIARLPSSTIQVLGAEKALFRALKTGGRPPKHGILFQHDDVHSSPKWQRGKVARSLANKIAIAARVDYFRGARQEGIEESLEKRLEEIRIKYKEPPMEERGRFRGVTRRERESPRGKRDEGRRSKKRKRGRKSGERH